MRQFQRGQRSKLGDLTPSRKLDAGVAIAFGEPVDFDISCFGVDENNSLSDDRYFVFYNQRRSPEGEIEALGGRDGDAEVFRIDLDSLPLNVRKLAFVVTIDGEGTMASISGGHLRLLSGSEEAVRYPFTGADFDEEKSLIIAEIYHKDIWRFAAVGQGFEGDLRAVLKHFGGEEAEEETSQPTSPPTTPLPGPVVRVEEKSELQKTIDEAAPGATVSLDRDEYEGPLTITKPLTLEGKSGVIWARRGPVLTVNSAGVVLRNVDVQVTVLDSEGGEEADLALVLEGGVEATLEGVSVRGRVVGLGEEGAAWKLPPALDLGAFAPRLPSTFVARLAVPVACRLESKVSGLTVEPAALAPGKHDVTLTVRDIPANALISGSIEVRSPRMTRTIAVTGGTVHAESAGPVSGVRVWG